MTFTDPPVSVALTDLGIPHRVFRHTGPVHSLEQAAWERGQIPAQVVRSLLFRIAAGNYIMVLVAGPAQVSWKALRQHVSQTRLTTADRDEEYSVTGYEIGAVAPFGLSAPIPHSVQSKFPIPRTLPSKPFYQQRSMFDGFYGKPIVWPPPGILGVVGACLDPWDFGKGCCPN
jgi:prolyl-tRNA editing enzyme YbaK/EbsC (Cys-tRNA(Pro) deacylase)